NRALTEEDVAALYAARNPGTIRYNTSSRVAEYFDEAEWIGFGPPKPTTKGLVGWWKLDETSGTTAKDSSGYDNDGTMQNGLDAATASVAGVIGTALAYGDADDRISVPSNALLEDVSSGQVTVSAWVNVADNGNAQDFVG